MSLYQFVHDLVASSRSDRNDQLKLVLIQKYLTTIFKRTLQFVKDNSESQRNAALTS